MMRPCHPHQQRGFTLLELLVVIAIFGVFALMAYGGLDSVLNTRRDIEVAQTRLAKMQKLYMRLRDDLQQVVFRPVRDNYGDPQPAFLASSLGVVEFSRLGWPNPLGLPRSQIQRVAYQLDDDKLLRLSWRVLDRAQDSAPVKNVLLDDVEDLQWRFLGADNQWHGYWPAENTGTAPDAVLPPLAAEITLRTKDTGELRFLFRLGAEPVVQKLPATGAKP